MWHYASLLLLRLLLPSAAFLDIRFICARILRISISWHFLQFFTALFRIYPPPLPSIVRRRNAFLIASDGERVGEGGALALAAVVSSLIGHL